MCFTFHLSAQNDGNYSHYYWSCSEPWKYRLELSLAVQRERSDEEEEVAPLSALLHEQGLFTAGMLNPFIFTYGESYLISAFQEEVLSLPPPYETMCSQYDSKSGEYSYADGVVQSEECSSKCIADNWQQHCSCFSKLYSVKHRRHGPICEYIDHLNVNTHCPKFLVDVEVERKSLQFEVDMGAARSLISEETYHKVWPRNAPQLSREPLDLRTWSGEELRVLGIAHVRVKFKADDCVLPLLVMKGAGCNLLGRDWLAPLHIQVDEPYPPGGRAHVGFHAKR
ncbi:hypothetical protein MTO96_020275 [Rhipicephalus appendiculatus]